MRHTELAISVAEDVLDRPRRPRDQRDQYGVRGLAAYLLFHTGGCSWGDISEAVYRKRAHNTALAAARRWAGTPEAERALEAFRRQLPPRDQADVWDVIWEIKQRVSVLEGRSTAR